MMRQTTLQLGKVGFDVCCVCRINQPDTVKRGEQWIATRWMKDDQ